MQLKSRSSGYVKRLLRVSNWLARRLQRLDARRLLVVHDEGAVVQLCDADVELAQQPEHAGLVSLLLLLVEPAVYSETIKPLVPMPVIMQYSPS